MGRLLLLVAIVVVIYLLMRVYRGKTTSMRDDSVAEDMVRCEQCGMHLPKGECIESGGQFYCCAEHRDTDRK